MKSFRRSVLWSLFTLASAAAVQAASPRDELLRFVPDDVGFCLILQDLRVHAGELAESPFVALVSKSPLGLAIQASKELVQLDKADHDLKQALGVGFDQLRDDILGDAVVFAYKPGPPDKPDQEEGLVLVRARTADVLAGLIDKVNAAQKKDGSLTDLQPVPYEGTTYYRRVEPKQTNFYYIRGAVLIFTSQEAMLRRALDMDRKPAAESKPAIGQRLHAVGADKAALALWVNPRAFDAGLADKAAKSEGTDAAQLKKVMAYWKAVDGIGVWATLDAEFHLSLAEQVRLEDLPPAAQRLAAAQGRPSEAWRYFPDDALLACGVRIDAGALVEMLRDLAGKEEAGTAAAAANAAFGQDFVSHLLTHIGPDWGFCLTAPATSGKDWTPRAVLVVRAAPAGDTAPVDQAVLSAVHTAALLAVVAYDQQHPTAPILLQTMTTDDREVHFFVGDIFPPGVRPSYALTNGWMVFASSPDVVAQFAATPPRPAPADGEAFPVLRVSVKAWRTYLKDRREPLAAALAEKNQTTVEPMRRQLDDLIAALQFVDRIEIDRRTGPGFAVVTLTVETAAPLKKVGE